MTNRNELKDQETFYMIFKTHAEQILTIMKTNEIFWRVFGI